MEVSTVGAGEGFVNVFYEGMSSRFGNVEVRFVIEGTLIEVPVLGLGTRKGYSVGVHCRKGVDNELVRRGGFGDFFSKGSVEHIDMQMGEEDL